MSGERCPARILIYLRLGQPWNFIFAFSIPGHDEAGEFFDCGLRAPGTWSHSKWMFVHSKCCIISWLCKWLALKAPRFFGSSSPPYLPNAAPECGRIWNSSSASSVNNRGSSTISALAVRKKQNKTSSSSRRVEKRLNYSPSDIVCRYTRDIKLSLIKIWVSLELEPCATIFATKPKRHSGEQLWFKTPLGGLDNGRIMPIILRLVSLAQTIYFQFQSARDKRLR